MNPRMSDENDANGKGEDEAQQKRRFQGGRKGAVEVTEKRGLKRIPVWLTRDKGLPDWLAGCVVVVASGLLLTLFVWILVVAWPA